MKFVVYSISGLKLIMIVLTICWITIRKSIAGNEKFYCLSETNSKHCTICCSGYGLEVMLPASGKQRLDFANGPISCYCLAPKDDSNRERELVNAK